jgi:hypothetical protein
MDEAGSNRHERLTASAFCNHFCRAAALLPKLDGAHDSECLSWERFPAKPREQRIERVFRLVEGLIRVSDSPPEVWSERTQVVEDGL